VRILVTGASGQLGSELVARRSTLGHEVVGVTHAECDVTDRGSVHRALDGATPDAVINCAAWTKVDLAESHREQAFAVNADGPALVAAACRGRNIPLCHLSTDYVFDGIATAPIDEHAEPHPINVYGESKLEVERGVRAALPGAHLIIRSSWVYGREGPNFVLTMLNVARERGELRVVADQVGTPTWTGHLARALVRALELGARGTMHLTSSGSTSWHGFAEAILGESGLTGVPVHAIPTSGYPTPAARPGYSVLDNRRWRELGEPALPAWRDGLREYLRERR
jgi:dTDP-4-dehydrorhamnose reductase